MALSFDFARVRVQRDGELICGPVLFGHSHNNKGREKKYRPVYIVSNCSPSAELTASLTQSVWKSLRRRFDV